MIDCFDGMVVNWSIGTRRDAELVNTMLDAALETVTTNSDRPLVHSDHRLAQDADEPQSDREVGEALECIDGKHLTNLTVAPAAWSSLPRWIEHA